MVDKTPKLDDLDIQIAYNKLSETDKENVDCLAANLEANYKSRWNNGLHKTKAQFSRVQALEVLAKLGMFYVNNNIGLPSEDTQMIYRASGKVIDKEEK